MTTRGELIGVGDRCTVDVAHVLIVESAGAASAYVGVTRGAERNVAHLVVESIHEARQQWVEVFGRDRADLGPAHAAIRAAGDVERYGVALPVPSEESGAEADTARRT